MASAAFYFAGMTGRWAGRTNLQTALGSPRRADPEAGVPVERLVEDARQADAELAADAGPAVAARAAELEAGGAARAQPPEAAAAQAAVTRLKEGLTLELRSYSGTPAATFVIPAKAGIQKPECSPEAPW